MGAKIEQPVRRCNRVASRAVRKSQVKEYPPMTELMGWRRWLTFATIDVLLVFAATTAFAASASHPPVYAPALPTLLVVGVGLFGASLGRHAKH
jgi:hypothetical protein